VSYIILARINSIQSLRINNAIKKSVKNLTYISIKRESRISEPRYMPCIVEQKNLDSFDKSLKRH
jgi:hypothetical protein